MIQILSYYKYNIKVLAKDQIPLLWSVIVPSIFLYFNSDYVKKSIDLRFWWAYIILTSYLYGIGIYAMTMKETGTLKTLFSICHQPFLFFFGNLLTQITYCVVCISIFNIVAVLYLQLPVLSLFMLSFVIILLSIPVAFFGMVLTLFDKVHVNSLSSLVNITIMVFFFSMNMSGPLQKINPILYYANLVILDSKEEIIRYSVISSIFIIIGSICIARFSVIPIEKR